MAVIGTITLLATIDTSQYKNGVKDIEKGNEDIASSAEATDKSVSKSNKSFTNLARHGLNYAAVGFATLGTTVGAMALKGGFDRVLNIEDAQAKLRGLGHDAESVSTIMENALSSVRGTAFGLDAAATTAANAVAAGIRPGRQLEQTLKTVASTAAVAGRGMDEIGAIFNKVAASNKVQMDTINQLHDAGVPALAFLANEMGKTAEETAKMASAGEINFETFERAMRKGVGDAALEMGNTTRGMLDNMVAAFSRSGAVIADRVLPHVRDAIGGITEWTKGVESALPGIIDGIIDQFSRITGVFSGIFASAGEGDFQKTGEQIGKSIAQAINVAFEGIRVSSEAISNWFGSIDWGDIGLQLGKNALAFAVGLVIGLLNIDWGAAWGVLADNWGAALIGVATTAFAPAKLLRPITSVLSKIPFAKTFIKFFITPLRNLGKPVQDALGDLFGGLGSSIGGFFSRIGGMVKTFGMILISPIRALVDIIADNIRLLPLVISNVFRGIWNIISNFAIGIWNFITNIFTGVWKAITTIMQPLVSFFSNMFTAIWNNISGIFSGAGNFFSNVFTGAVNIIKSVFGVIVQWFSDRWQNVVSIFSGVAGWFRGIFQGAWNAITGIFGGIVNWFRGMWDRVVSLFGNAGTRVGNAIGGAIRGVLNGVLSTVERALNTPIDIINGALGALRELPGLGGLGNIGRLNLPRLAKGGIVQATPGGILANIGEGGEAEAVIPLSKLDQMLSGDGSGGKDVTVNQYNTIHDNIDMNIATRYLTKELARA